VLDQRSTILAAMTAQAAAALLLCVLVFGYYLYYRKSYLRHWAFNWLALFVYQIASPAALFLAKDYEAVHPVRILLTVVSMIAVYLQPAYLLFGSWEVSTQRPVRARTRTRILWACAATGVLLTLPYLAGGRDAAVERYFVRFGLKTFVAAGAFLAAAWLISRGRSHRKGPGFIVVSLGFFLFGIQQAHYFVNSILWTFYSVNPPYSTYMGFIDFVLLCFIGIGMVTCLLEDEREALVLASEQIEHLAYHDSLTGLPNRAMFLDRLIIALSRAERRHQKIGVLFIDLDRFKEINDSLGHTVGDQLLKLVAERLRTTTRETDSLARFGGDEFTLMLDDLSDMDDGTHVAQKIIESLRVPFHVGEHELFVSGSVGLSFYPDDGGDADTLVRNADTAMYRAKEQGRDSYQLYAPAMNVRALERLALEQMLRKAITNGEFVLHYQPLIHIERDHKVFGVEALVRWNNPELGLVAPSHFIAAAENSGLIIPIGAWVLKEACQQAAAWTRSLGVRLIVSVNLSARQFQQPTLIDEVREALAESDLDPRQLELEITESSAMQNAENTARTLRALKRIGVRISMDDFGTGYSSLSYLKRFPIDTLKLDQSFVRDIVTDSDDGAIATAVLAMGHSLSLEVIAEGVEKEDQLQYLRERGCRRFQGFLFSAPLPPEEIGAFVGRRIARASKIGSMQ
jgi:diguanylate cyclase (GGDEF)-like protein